MQFTKPVIDLVFEIRKEAPTEIRPKIKLTNPKLLVLLVETYKRYDEASLKSLIRQVIELADPASLPMLSPDAADQSPKPEKRMYRGQPVAQPESKRASNVQNHPKRARAITYRGQKLAAS